mmetsp:Transcript_129968/g.259268  ORF Transcript_129968/g.259268 Transcript_129968/m.259268 type:complete len:498 (-) Transcript_129968:275-1768(-)
MMASLSSALKEVSQVGADINLAIAEIETCTHTCSSFQQGRRRGEHCGGSWRNTGPSRGEYEEYGGGYWSVVPVTKSLKSIAAVLELVRHSLTEGGCKLVRTALRVEAASVALNRVISKVGSSSRPKLVCQRSLGCAICGPFRNRSSGCLHDMSTWKAVICGKPLVPISVHEILTAMVDSLDLLKEKINLAFVFQYRLKKPLLSPDSMNASAEEGATICDLLPLDRCAMAAVTEDYVHHDPPLAPDEVDDVIAEVMWASNIDHSISMGAHASRPNGQVFVDKSISHPSSDHPALRDENVVSAEVRAQVDDDFALHIEGSLADGVREFNLSSAVHVISFRSGKGELFRRMLLQDKEFSPLRKSLQAAGYPLILQPSKAIVLVRPDQYLDVIDSNTLRSHTLKRYMVIVAESEEYLMDEVLLRMASKQRPRKNRQERVKVDFGSFAQRFVINRTFLCPAPRMLQAGTVAQSTTEACNSDASGYLAHCRGANPRRRVLGEW